MSEYVWVCLYKQDSEYSSGPKYAKILNMLKYGRVLNMGAICNILNMPECMPWQRFEYILAGILGSIYARILNMAGLWIYKSYTGF